MGDVRIAPSLLSADFMHLDDDVKDCYDNGVTRLHYDVMDGHFVPNISFGASILKNIRADWTGQLDVHLMISDPLFYLEDFVKAGADLITFHVEAMESVEEGIHLIQEIQSQGVKAGVSLNPGTAVDAVKPYLDYVDLVLVMSVQPGFGGQKFNPVAVPKIAELSALKDGRHFEIEVDGGINAETIKECRDAGCDWFVAGSSFFGRKDRANVIAEMS